MSRDDSWFSLLSRLGLGKLLLQSATDLKHQLASDLVYLLVMLLSCPLSIEVITASLFFFFCYTQKRGANQQKKRSKVGVHLCLELYATTV